MTARASGPAIDLRAGTKLALWDTFCAAHRIAESGVPLFATGADGAVEVFAYGRDGRPMLRRSTAMEGLLIGAVERALAGPPTAAEGVLYLMHRVNPSGRVVPLYAGKAGRYGRTDAVSANLAAIRTNAAKFARGGYNYAYHMGDLSAATLPSHAADKPVLKYQRWTERLFVQEAGAAPRQKFPVRFWCTAWGPKSPNIWTEFGACPLASNSEGVNRAGAAREEL